MFFMGMKVFFGAFVKRERTPAAAVSATVISDLPRHARRTAATNPAAAEGAEAVE